MSPGGLLEIGRHNWSYSITYSTHAFHGTWTDVARMVGETPTFAFEVSAEVAKGFGMDDVEALGHWRRKGIERHGVPRSSPGSERMRGQGGEPDHGPALLERYG